MKRHKHSLSHYHLLTAEMGGLYPVGHYEVLPGDTVQQHTSALIRLSPPQSPVMHPALVRFHTFFVPYRLVWDGFEDFITGGADGIGGAAGTYPTITAGAGGFAAKSLPDYMGIKPGAVAQNIPVSALPIRAYNLIWNEHYRDRDLQTELAVPTTSGADVTSPTSIQPIAWEKDRFTMARPWQQRGPAVTLPLGTQAPVKSTGSNVSFTTPGGSSVIQSATGGAGAQVLHSSVMSGGGTPFTYGNANATVAGLYTDLTGATASTITDLRYALGIQQYREARALYGSEYVDYLRYLGLRPADGRLQRPEYVGGAKQTVSWSEIVQSAPNVTAGTSGTTGVGDLTGHGIAAMRTRGYRHFFPEHGICMTLMSVRPRSMYGDGLERMWSRRVKEDYWQKELERIGQEPVYRRELYTQSDANGGNTVFGYADRYSDYRTVPSRVSGEFRTSTMWDWHMARFFAAGPTLNAAFVLCDPTDRIYQDQTAGADHLWCMVNHKIAARRFVARSGQIARIV